MVALCAACLASPALAGSELTLGDGASANNERLLPGVFPDAPVLANANGVAEPYDPFFDVDWSVGLRGTYTDASAGQRFDLRLVPNVSLEHIGTRSAINFDANAEIIWPHGGETLDISALRLGLQAGYDLDRDTRVTGTGNLALTRAIAGTPGVASNLEQPPQVFSGDASLGLTRRFGKFNVGVTGEIARTSYGESTLVGGAVVDNAEQNYWSYDGTLRVGYQVTPIFEVFGQAGLGRDVFDNPSIALGTKADATDATLEGGVTGRWNSVLEASVSTGVALRRFDESSLGEVVTQLYDASVTFTPDPTWRFTAGLTTIVAPPGPTGSGTTRIDHVLRADVGYTVNSWLALRALAGWNTASFTGSAATEDGYDLGLGADYSFNAHTSVSADYVYGYSDSTNSGIQDAHQVTVGVTVSR